MNSLGDRYFSQDYGQNWNTDLPAAFNQSFELYEFHEALTPYGTIETKSPTTDTLSLSNFNSGKHFRTGTDENGSLQLELENRLLTLILDESGSMTWNDQQGLRYTFYKRLLSKLEATYPGIITANLIGFGASLVNTSLFISRANIDTLTDNRTTFTDLLQAAFEDSVYDFSGVRVVRRSDRFPGHPADGIIVGEGIFEAIKDANLTEEQQYYYGIWTFNKNQHFSEGVFLKITPRDRILPSGVNLFTALPRLMPGVKRDELTELIYNFTENEGYLIFDSSGNGLHGVVGTEVVEDNFWAGDATSSTYINQQIKKSQGVRFDGEFDIVETEATSPILLSYSNSLTVNFWLFRYTNSEDQWVIGTSSLEPSNNINWVVGITSSGLIGCQIGDISTGLSPIGLSVIPVREWTMITVTFTNAGGNSWNIVVYKNGVEDGTSTIINSPDLDADRLYIGAKPVTSGTNWTGVDYFGSLGQVNIHSTNRNINYISDLYTQELEIFNQPLQAATDSAPDNTQREVLLSWDIGKDFDFSGGSVTIVRKYNSVPYHIDDGEIVVRQTAEVGQFFYLDTAELILGGNYYYRIFTTNSLGNVCDKSEARLLSVRIPYLTNNNSISEIDPVSDISIISGNGKLLLQWSNPVSEDWAGTKIFFGCESFPSVSINNYGSIYVTNGKEIVDTTEAFFAHRSVAKTSSGAPIPLSNGITHFYSIVTYDKLGRISSPVLTTGVPSVQLSTVFEPERVTGVHYTILNPHTVSLQWKNPTVKSEQIDLYFGDAASIYVNIRDIFGGEVEDVKNIKLQFCTTFITRDLKTSEIALGSGGEFPPALGTCADGSDNEGSAGLGDFGSFFDPDCNSEEQINETILTYATPQSGLVKGIITHTNDRQILARRERYAMDVRAQYNVANESSDSIFEYNTDAVRVTFKHPIKMTLINRDKKKISIGKVRNGGYRGDDSPCDCPNKEQDETNDTEQKVNGGYAGANQPYVCRVEIQYRGESLPNGIPVNVQLFKHGTGTNPNPLSEKSDRTFIREGLYPTTSIETEELDFTGQPTGRMVSKSFVDVEVPHPQINDYVDVYITLDYLGFFVDAVHEIRFIESLLIRLDTSKPAADGIDTAEQFATVWTVDPDNPNDPDARVPVPDGTIVKWELEKLSFGKERPFYSTEVLPQISGIYSTTRSGVARSVFFGPVGNIENHESSKHCDEESPPEPCCVGEQYAIRANVILGTESATDAVKLFYPCKDVPTFTNKRFLMNADPLQPFAGGSQSSPHWITWADGEHMVKFQIAQNPAISDVLGADCFRRCVEARVGGQLIPFAEGQIVQITAPGEILWNVIFEEDPYTGVQTPISYDSISPKIAENLNIPFVANIPITGETTDFYIRQNIFVGDSGNPKPEECENNNSGGSGSTGSDILPCEYRNICDEVTSCSDTNGQKWVNVSEITGIATLISANKEISLLGGGTYDTGIPPIYAGFREPLDVRIIDARINGQRVDELVVDGVSQHTFTVEVTFAGNAVPDGTPIELVVKGSDQQIVIISNCINRPESCKPGRGGIIYARNVNDDIINPQDESGLVPARSLAYFSIDPLPNIGFNAKIEVTCHYDKLGTAEREVTRCIELNNEANNQPPTEPPPPPGQEPVIESATSNETIVYDSILDRYSLTKSSQTRRMGHFCGSITNNTLNYICIFGGMTGTGDSSTTNLTGRSEIFNVSTTEWMYTSDMPTPRAFGMSVSVGQDIYCIGGIELDPLLKQYTVSRKIEKFNIGSETWVATLQPLPEDYSIAYGDAQIDVAGEYIYVTCGIKELINNSQPGQLNDRVLRYDINADIWDTILPSNQDLYKRIAPFGFLRSEPNVFISDTETLSDNNDDAQDVGGVYATAGASHTAGQPGGIEADAYFRFPINIGKGSLVRSASLELYLTASTSPLLQIYAIDADDFEDLATANPTTTASMTAVIEWQPTTTTGAYVASVDISPILQQFIDRPNYELGNHVVLVLDGSLETMSRSIDFDSAAGSGAKLNIEYRDTSLCHYYIYSGSIAKDASVLQSERQAKINRLLDEFRAFTLGSAYFQNLPLIDQNKFIEDKEKEINNGVVVPAFVYPPTGFKMLPGAETIVDGELTIDISDTVEDEWRVLPKARDNGKSVYIGNQDSVYFIGGGDQNKSTTLNRVETIDLGNNNIYSRLTSLSRGRSMMSLGLIDNDIYIIGGLTSGHKDGYIQIDVQPNLYYVEALGTETSGFLVTLKNDSGEIVDEDVRIDVRGQLRIPEIDSILTTFIAERAAERAIGDTDASTAADIANAQNKIIDPDSDQFQFGAARKLNQEITLFPVLYSSQEIVIQAGVGGVTLLPRSEDPLSNLEQLSEFIDSKLANTPEDPDERFSGDLTRDELRALGDTLAQVQLPPTIINSKALRDLYTIETTFTVLDSDLFGQTVSEFDLNLQQEIEDKIEEKLTPPPPTDNPADLCSRVECPLGYYCVDGECVPRSNALVKDSPCFLLQHAAAPDLPIASTPPQSDSPRNPRGTGGFAQSGQCLYCQTILPTQVDIKPQLPTVQSIFYNATDWLPQIKKRLVNSNHSLSEVIDELDIIDHEVPFGSSQLYDAMTEAAMATSGSDLDDLKKSIYIVSDNSQNLSITSRTDAIEEVNSIDGDKNVPVIYTIFNTSFPITLASQLETTDVGDVDKITQQTGGQSLLLLSPEFIDQILNIAIGGATGGLGYGIYTTTIPFTDLTAITDMTINFELPSNTQGYVRLRFSEDGFNFTDFSERYEGSQSVDFSDFFAKIIEIEIVLTTGFTISNSEEYDDVATGIPKLISITFGTSQEREDFLWLNSTEVLTNAQQVAMAFEGDIPANGIVELGVATSTSHDWRDFQSTARPAIEEFGKTFLLDRTSDPDSLVPIEKLTTIDNQRYRSPYGPWDAKSTVTLLQLVTETDGTINEVPVTTGFVSYPREGEIYFDTKQDPNKIFKLAVVNDSTLRVGVRLRNRLHTDNIKIRGIGYIYSTNNDRPPALSQVAPQAINVQISPVSPTASDTIFALYNYVDLNNDKESGSILSWFKNGSQLFEIQNKLSWNNDDLLPSNKLQPNDKISYSISPSDGRDFGTTKFSTVATITARPPNATDVRIVPFRNGIINNRFDTSSAFTIEYTFETEDTGTASLEDGTTIKWFVNNQLFKEGIFSEITAPDPYFDPKSITPGEILNGISAHIIGNQITCEVTPKTLLVTGEIIKPNAITVENSIMAAKTVSLQPLQPNINSTLVLAYTVDDLDITDFKTQTDQSEKRWYKSTDGRNFSEVTELRNQLTAPPFYVRAGERWNCEITPFDGLDTGAIARSNTVTIHP